MLTIYFGTTNPGKVRELASILSHLGINIEPVSLDVPETGDTFLENSRLKALAYAKHTQGLTICEDSGLVVHALGDLPGPYSARFSEALLDGHKVVGMEPSGRTREEIDQANNERVLRMLEGVPMRQRAACFVVRLTVAQPGKIVFETVGNALGWISEEPRGDKGFGYDPIFIGNDTFGKTYAELDNVRKNSRSHRTQALSHLQDWMSQLIRSGVLDESP